MGDVAWTAVAGLVLVIVIYFAGRLVRFFGTRAYSEASKVSMINRYLVWRDRGPDDPRDPD